MHQFYYYRHRRQNYFHIKWLEQFPYFGSNISYIETDVNIYVTQPFTRPLDVWPDKVGDQISAELVVYARWEL